MTGPFSLKCSSHTSRRGSKNRIGFELRSPWTIYEVSSEIAINIPVAVDSGSSQDLFGRSIPARSAGTWRSGVVLLKFNESGIHNRNLSRATGNGYRVPAEALIRGASPVIEQVSANPSRLVRLSENPFIPLVKARNLAANCNIEPNF